VVGQILLDLGVFFLYSLGVSIAVFLLPPAYGAAAALFVFWMVVRWYVLPRDRPDAGEGGLLRLQGLRGPLLGWTLGAVPVLLLISWALGEVYLGLVPVPPRILNPFGILILDPARRALIAVLAIAVAPMVEELVFRGLIQRRLELRWGPAPAILATAVLFALVHIDTLPWVLPLHVFLGLVFGWVVCTTRSIWSGVILHAANNSAAIAGIGAADAPRTRPTIWEIGVDSDWLLALGIVVLSLPLAAWLARRLRDAARQ
jgi:membrane protease YdiL (CAAX protease family)